MCPASRTRTVHARQQLALRVVGHGFDQAQRGLDVLEVVQRLDALAFRIAHGEVRRIAQQYRAAGPRRPCWCR